ncbi:MAG: (d)CMP kinase, partial [Candidatus Omnitrophota bacterium]
LQRKIGEKSNSVLEGRDIGTVVFPNAKYKFYLDAHIDERVKRRHKELIEQKKNVDKELVARDLTNRDTIDSTREVAPLKKADDAIYVDTTNLNIEQVVEKVFSYIKI